MAATEEEVFTVAPVVADNSDVLGMKHAMDDLLWAMLESRFPKDNHISNVRIGVSLLCCALSVFSYKAPLPHPKDFYLQIVVIPLFTILYWGMHWYIARNEGTIVFKSLPFSRSNKVVQARSSVAPGVPVYSLAVELLRGPLVLQSFKAELPFTEYWDRNGSLAQHKYGLQVAALIKAVERLKDQ
eukprot:c336_g1_i1.p1 GENE.c336_g1_i1~~c336_g1_i1.p1  ORF type:complete len:195 (+),score=39.99 c336_g1_i1:32-586(+)